MPRFVVLLLLLSGIGLLPVEAQPVLEIDSAQNEAETGLWADWLADPTRRLTLADVTRPVNRQRFRRIGKRYPNAGYTFDDYWLRVRVRVAASQDPTDDRLFFENMYPIATRVNLFILDSTGRLLEKHEATSCSLGDRREVPHPNFVFTSRVRPGQLLTVYVHVHSEMGQQFIALTVWREKAFLRNATNLFFGWGIYTGFAALALVLHLFTYGFTGERRYLLVGFTVVSYLLYESSRGVGLGMRHLWPNNTWLLIHGVNLFFSLWLFAYVLFFIEILQLRSRSPRLYKLFLGLLVINVAGFLLTLPPWFASRALVPTVKSTIIVLTVLVTGGYFVWRGERNLTYYVVGTLFLLLGGLLLAASWSGLFTYNSTLSSMMISTGTSLEIICFTLGVAVQIRRERREKREVLFLQRENEQQLVFEQRRRELDEAEARLMVQINERREIADNLHDNLGGMLFNIHARMSSLSSGTAVGPEEIAPLRDLVSQTHQRVRLIAHNLMPEELSQQGGLIPALSVLIGELNQVPDTAFGMYLDPALSELPGGLQLDIYYIVFELLGNVLRHARATEASLQIRCSSDLVSLSVQDNGIGVSKSLLTDSRAFASIRRRTQRLGGQFSISRVPDGGTRADISLPR